MSSPACAAANDRVPLYAKRETIYQKEVMGWFQRARAAALFVLAGVFLVGPWLPWGERQAVWFDVPNRRFHLFGLTFWPQDFIFLSWLLIIAAFGLFFVTTIAGRLWCGYACPQTVWTKLFMWIEWLTEGDRNQRMRLDRSVWSARKAGRKLAKHALWLAVALVVGTTFVGYFLPIRTLLPRIGMLDLGTGEWVFVAIASLALYADAGWMREQVCKYVCPYARFQGAMFDTATLTIFYDRGRGEPRGHRSRATDPARAQLGSCIDCGLCVQVCPTGIDIRKGTQSECIGCAACIDVCDRVMDDMEYPRGLIRYTTEDALAGKPIRVLRPRVVAYGTMLAAMSVLFVWSLAHRVPFAVDVLRDRARLYRLTADGDIENVYTLKIMNKDQAPHAYRVAVAPSSFALSAPESIEVPAGGIADVPVRVRVAPEPAPPASAPVTFAIARVDDPERVVEEASRFLAPRAAGARP